MTGSGNRSLYPVCLPRDAVQHTQSAEPLDLRMTGLDRRLERDD